MIILAILLSINQLFSIAQNNQTNKVLTFLEIPTITRMDFYENIRKGNLEEVKKCVFLHPQIFENANIVLLNMATLYGHTDIVEFLLSQGLSANESDGSGTTALHIAIENQHKQIVILLLNNGADVDQKNFKKITPLMKAVQEESSEIVQLLIDKGANIYAIDKQLSDAFNYAQLASKKDHLQKLHKKHDSLYAQSNRIAPFLINQHDEEKKVILSNLAKHLGKDPSFFLEENKTLDENFQSGLAELIDSDPSLLSCQNNEGNTPLHIAIEHKQNEVVKLLLQKKAPQEKMNNKEQTPLMYACTYMNNECIQLLINNKVNVNASIDDICALDYALEYAEKNNDFTCAQLLVNNQANVTITDKKIRFLFNKKHYKSILFLFKNNKEMKTNTSYYTNVLFTLTHQYGLGKLGEKEEILKLIKILFKRGVLVSPENFKVLLLDSITNNQHELTQILIHNKKEYIFDRFTSENSEFQRALAFGDKNMVALIFKEIYLQDRTNPQIIPFLEQFYYYIEAQDQESISEHLKTDTFLLKTVNSQLQSPLHIAIQNNIAQFVERFIIELFVPEGSSDSSLDKQDNTGTTPLILATQKGHRETVSLLLMAKVDSTIKDNQGKTALDYIQEKKETNDFTPTDQQILEMLEEFTKTKELPLKQNKQKFASLVTALKENRIQDILSSISKDDPCLQLKDDNEDTLLHLALKQKEDTLAQHLIRAGAPINSTNSQKQTPLILAAQHKKTTVDTVELLLQKGAQTDRVDHKKKNALFYAVSNKSQHLIPILLNNTNITKNNENTINILSSQIIDLIKKGDLHTLQTMVEKSPKYLQLKQTNKQAPLYVAIEFKQNHIVQYLIKNEIDIEGNVNFSPLMLAVTLYNTEAIQMLIQAGAHVDHKIIHYCVNIQHGPSNKPQHKKRLLQLFMQKEIDFNLCPHILHIAFENNWYDLALEWMKKGALIDTLNRFAQTPLSILINQVIKNLNNPFDPHAMQCIEYLLQQGVNPFIEIEDNPSPFELAVFSKDFLLVETLLKSQVSHAQTTQGYRRLLEISLQFRHNIDIFQTLALYDPNSKEFKDDFFLDNVIIQPPQIALEMIQIYQPSNEILLKAIPHCQSLETSLLLLSYLPLKTPLPQSNQKTLITELITLIHPSKENLPLTLLLMSTQVGSLFSPLYQTHILPRFIDTYIYSNCSSEQEKNEKLVSLLIESLDTPKSKELFIQQYEDFNAQPIKPEELEKHFYNTVLSNFFSSIKKEDQITIFNLLVETKPEILYPLLEELDKPFPSASVSFAFPLAQQSKHVFCQSFCQQALQTYPNNNSLWTDSTLDLTYTQDDILKLIKQNNPSANKKWIEQHFEQFEQDFLQSDKPPSWLHNHFPIIHLESFLSTLIEICVNQNNSPMIKVIILSLDGLPFYQRAIILRTIFKHSHFILPPSLYPFFTEPYILDPQSYALLMQQVENQLDQIAKEFQERPLPFIQRPHCIIPITTLFCKSTDHLTTVQLILEHCSSLSLNQQQQKTLLLKIFNTYPEIVSNEHLEIILINYLSSQHLPPLGIKKAIQQYITHLNLKQEFPSIESQVLFLALQLKLFDRIQTIDISFKDACFALAQWVKLNPQKTLETKNFFLKQELGPLDQAHQYMYALVNYEKKTNQETFEYELQELGLSLDQKEIYQKFIYPWASVIHLRSFEINPDIRYKKPLYAKEIQEERKKLFQKQTPFWEILTWVNLEHPELHTSFLKLFEPIWKTPQSTLCQNLEEITPILFMELQTNETIQKNLVLMLQQVQNNPMNQPQKYEPLINEFIQKNIDKEMKELPLELLSFISLTMPDFYENFKQFLKRIQHTDLFKSIIVNESLITYKLNEDRYENKFIDILKTYLTTTPTQENTPSIVEKLQKLINEFIPSFTQEELYEQFNDEINQLYLPLETLHWIKQNTPSYLKLFKQLLRKKTNSYLFKKLCIFDRDIFSALLTEEDQHETSFQSKWVQLFDNYSKNKNKNNTQTFLNKLEALLDTKITALEKEELELRFQDYKEKRKRNKVYTGNLFFAYLKKVLPHDDEDSYRFYKSTCDSFLLWKHRLLNNAIPFAKSITGQESNWYYINIKTLKEIEKILTLEEEEIRLKHLEKLTNILDTLKNCASQSQSLFLDASTVLFNRPQKFESLEEAFLDAALNCRTEILNIITAELTQKTATNIHTRIFVYQVAFQNFWGILQDTNQEIVTQHEDPYYASKQQKDTNFVKQAFHDKYQVGNLILEHFLRQCLPESFYTKKPEDPANPEIVPYRDVIYQPIQDSYDTWSQDHHEFIIRIEDITQSLHKTKFIQKKKNLIPLFAGAEQDIKQDKIKNNKPTPKPIFSPTLTPLTSNEQTDSAPGSVIQRTKLKQKMMLKRSISSNKTRRYA